MYGDSQALSPDSCSRPRPIFPANSCRDKQDVSPPMESDANSSSNYSTHDYTPSPNSTSNSNSMVVNHASGGEGLFSPRFGEGTGNGNAKSTQLPPQYPRQTHGVFRGHAVVGSSGLFRQSSSPPGLMFSQIIPQNNGYNIGSYRMTDDGTNGELSPSSITLKNQINSLSGAPSSLGLLSRFTEVVQNENGAAKVGNDGSIGGGDSPFFSSGLFPFSSWNDSSHFAENFSTIKREPDNDHKLFATGQDGQPGNRPSITTLSHHLSLPKTSSEMLAMEKLLQLQDTVPCKIRAKRGCATHPRSIAERVRRTRISERMRKLQELVPNMDKQTNTSDMLDLAVDYIKSLQKQYKALSDDCANCNCSASLR